MKNFRFVFLIVCLLFLFVLGNNQAFNNSEEKQNMVENAPQKEIEKILIHGHYLNYGEENLLFDDAELVVVAKPNKYFIDREHVINYFSSSDPLLPPAIEDFYTRTTITITKVLKSLESPSVSTGDSLSIIEPVALLKDKSGLKKLSIENYLELEKGKQYVLYLKKNTYGEYSIINMNNGRFNLEFTENIINISEHGHETDKEKHEEIKKDVIKRFEKELVQLN